MANILAATIRLLEVTDPKDITLRDVARESGHGPRLIIEWFGGKGGLFAAVFEKVFRDLIESGELFFVDVVNRPDVRAAFRIFNFMQVNHRDLVMSLRDGLVLRTVQERLTTNLGLSEDAANVAARRLGTLIIGVVLFRDYFDLTDDEASAIVQNEFRTTTGFSLAANPNPIDPTA